MANTLANLTRMSSATVGAGTLTLDTAVTGCLTFDQGGITNGQTVTYAIEDYDGSGNVNQREIGAGVYTSATKTLTRSVYKSTNSDAAISCSGSQQVFITVSKEDLATYLTSAVAASTYQPLDSDLTTLAANITAFGHSLVDDADASAARTTLGLGTMATETATNYLTTAAAAAGYQPLDGELTAIAGLTSAADRLPYFTGSGTASLATFTAAGRALIDDADASAQRTTLGLGTAAVKNTGTSGNNVPLLDGLNTWSANQLITKASPVLQLNATSGDANFYISAVSGSAATARWGFWNGSAFVDRWLFGKDATAESGSNAGSNFAIYAYTDAGAFLATVLTIARADSSANFRGGVYSNGVTGGSKGAGTINFGTLYEGGTALTAKYAQLAAANVFTTAQTVRVDDASTNAVTVGATLSHTTSGTPAAGIGVGLNFEAETSAGNNEIGARISAVTTDVTAASEDFDIVFSAMAAGAAVAEVGRVTSKGTYKHKSFTVAGLPAGTAGEACFASNGRKNGEGVGAGTGVLVFHDGTNWCACDTGAAVAA